MMMLTKSMQVMKSQSLWLGISRASFAGTTRFRSGAFSDEKLGNNFSFPKHKELFNDKYYEESSHKSPFDQDAKGPFT